MDDEIERIAQAIHDQDPVTMDGQNLRWEQVVQTHPDRAMEYREAASNRIKAAEAMKRLDAHHSKS